MDEFDLARELAAIGAEISMSHFARNPSTSIKKDGTLVTVADQEAESAMRSRIREVFPDHGIVGEEEGAHGEKGGPVWVIDPIDGTNNFASGIPVFATLVGLRLGGRTEIGVVNAPALGEVYEAGRADGARMNGQPIRVSQISSLAEATFCLGGYRRMDSAGYGRELSDLLARSRRDRGFGDFWGHMLVARGAVEVMVEPSLAIWDVAALEVIVEEAGGRITGFRGAPYPESRVWGTEGEPSCLTTNGHLHEEVVRALRGD